MKSSLSPSPPMGERAGVRGKTFNALRVSPRLMNNCLEKFLLAPASCRCRAQAGSLRHQRQRRRAEPALRRCVTGGPAVRSLLLLQRTVVRPDDIDFIERTSLNRTRRTAGCAALSRPTALRSGRGRTAHRDSSEAMTRRRKFCKKLIRQWYSQ